MKVLHRVAVALFATLLSLGASTSASADKTKVGFIYIGPPGDHGWTYAHDQARLQIDKELGDQVQTTFVEGVPEGPDAERTIAKLAQTGHKLIFTTSFGYMEPTLKVAKRFPEVKFEHATGYKRADNVATYSARFYEGRYVQGVIAGKVSKSGVIGYIASFPIPEVVRGINAFMLGAHTQNPNIKVKVVWVFTWYDPGKEADAAKVLMDQGADIITQHTDSTAALQAAADRGIHAFGQASDMIQFAPKTQLTAIIDAWGPYYVARTKALLDGSWKSQDTWDGMGAGMVVMAPFTNMPSDVAALAQKTYDDLRTGKLHAFSGPINDQSGKQVVAAGAVADDGMLAGMNFYIEGIDGELPK
ncbi:MAG: BMP family ABC transporter substrate-binding protein [Pseudomonadota bacterium]|nr:BMP family ABC transporter substrate-binding protein [Pseudomonadota bacterium]